FTSSPLKIKIIMNITFIGLGIMGSRMAANLLKSEAKIRVWNRSPAAAEALIAAGANFVANAREAVANADVVFSMLSTPAVVETLFFGPKALLSGMPKKSLWVDCTTVNPSFTKRARAAAWENSIRFLGAPVAGTKPQAEGGELVFFVGGAAEDLTEIQPYLDLMGKKTLHLGEEEQGAAFKMLVNIMLAQSMLIFSEAVLLGEKLGLDKDFLLNTLPNLVVSAPFTKFKAEMIRTEEYDVQFPLEWMQKDLHLASVTAYEVGQPLYLANIAKELFAGATQAGLGREDFAAIHAYLKG
ncbi:MAG: NAD(P)-dependent oxidoreductase, partial [Bacteroidota bacterium]